VYYRVCRNLQQVVCALVAAFVLTFLAGALLPSGDWDFPSYITPNLGGGDHRVRRSPRYVCNGLNGLETSPAECPVSPAYQDPPNGGPAPAPTHCKPWKNWASVPASRARNPRFNRAAALP